MNIKQYYNRLFLLLQLFLLLYIIVPQYLAFSLGFFYVSVDRLVLFLLIVFWFFGVFNFNGVRKVLRNRLKNNRAIVILFSMFLVFNLISVFFSVNTASSIKRFINFFLYNFFSFFILLSIPLNRKVLLKIGKLLLLASAIICFYGVLEIVIGENIFAGFLKGTNISEYQEANLMTRMRGGERRIQASFANPLVLGQFIVLIMPVLLYFRKFTNLNKFYFSIVIMTLMLLTFFIKSRATILILMLIVIYGLYYFLFLTKAKFGLKALLLLSFSVLFIVGLSNIDIGLITSFFDGKDLASDDSRETQLIMAVPIIFSAPWSGVGFGMGATVLDFGSLGRANGTIDNYFLTVVLDAGILALVAFVSLIGKCIILYFKVQKTNKFIIVGLLFFMINLLSLSLTEAHPLFYFLLALLLILESKDVKSRHSNNFS